MQHTEILEALGVLGTSGKTNCPAHDDEKASLSVTLSDEDKILVRCHAGCEQDEVLYALEREYGITVRDLGNGEDPAPKEIARYVYRDGAGNPVFTKIRFKPKDFVIEPAGADTKSHLYNLPGLLAAAQVKTVLWVEGEKAVDRLVGLGFLATTMGGAAKAPDKAAKVLRGRRVVIIPDNDDAGRKHAETVSRCLKAVGVQAVRILHLPGIPVKGDVVDWLDSGGTPEELARLVRQVIGVTPLSSVPIADPAWAWKPRVPATGLTLIFGEAGIGKSTMVLDLVARWTRGDPMPESVGTTFRPVNVGLYGCEDDMSSVVVPRLMAAGANLDRVVLLELDPTKPVLPNQVPRMRELCKENDIHILVLDNIENGMGAIETNDSRSLRSALNPLSDFGMPVIAIHHPKKGSLGGSAREAMTGSQAYTNVARSTMMVIRDEDGLVAFAPVKSNYIAVNQTRTLYFRLGSRDVDGLNESQPVVEWVGGDHTSADNLMARALKRRQDAISASLALHASAPSGLAPTGTKGKDEENSLSVPPPSSGATLVAPGRGVVRGEPIVAQVSSGLFPVTKDFTCPTDSKGLISSIPLDNGNKKVDQFVDNLQKKFGYGKYQREEEE